MVTVRSMPGGPRARLLAVTTVVATDADSQIDTKVDVETPVLVSSP